MNFEDHANNRIVTLTNFEFFEKPSAEYKEGSRLTLSI